MKSKQIVLRISLSLLIVLGLCTAASFRIRDLMLPQVTVLPVFKTLPAVCIVSGDSGPSVMCVLEREGVWGTESYVVMVPVQIDAYEGEQVRLTSELPGNRNRVVWYSSRPLEDGEVVKTL